MSKGYALCKMMPSLDLTPAGCFATEVDEDLDADQRAELARYLADVRRVATVPLVLGIALAVLGVGAVILRGTVARWLPELLPAVLIVAALGLMAIGIVRRIRYTRATFGRR